MTNQSARWPTIGRTIYKLFLQGKREKLIEYTSIFLIGLVGNVFVSEVTIFLVPQMDFYRYIDFLLLFQIVFLASLALILFFFSSYIEDFEKGAELRHQHKKDAGKTSLTRSEYVIKEIDDGEYKTFYQYARWISIALLCNILTAYFN
jgi:hypothetical protein